MLFPMLVGYHSPASGLFLLMVTTTGDASPMISFAHCFCFICPHFFPCAFNALVTLIWLSGVVLPCSARWRRFRLTLLMLQVYAVNTNQKERMISLDVTDAPGVRCKYKPKRKECDFCRFALVKEYHETWLRYSKRRHGYPVI